MDIDEYIKSQDALFHYTKTSIAIEHILYEKQFKLSLLKDTNDPREYKFKLFSVMGWSLKPNTTSELLNRAQTAIDRILRQQCRVMCFCTNKKPNLILNDGNTIEDTHICSEGWSKSRMWAQYGQNHYGICLVFSKEEINNILNGMKSEIRDFKASYVKYSQQYQIDFDSITLDGNRLENEGVEEYSFKHVLENSEEFFFTKHIDYRDEAEFRFVIFEPHRKDTYKNLEYLDVKPSLKCVIVGDRTPEAYFHLINKMCVDLNIVSGRAYWDRGKPHLLFCKNA